MHNAKAGGEIGANGEFYKGGQFVADKEDTIKGIYIKKGPRKIQVEPYKWVLADRDTFAIWQYLEFGVSTWRHGKKLDVADWFFISPNSRTEEFDNEMLKMYKEGKRTISLVEFGNLRKRTNAGPYWITNKLDVREFATI